MTTPQLTIGFDLGTRYSELFAITAAGEVVAQERVATTRQDVEQRFEDFEHATVVIEAGPVTMWIKELLESLGHAVIVANPREVDIRRFDESAERLEVTFQVSVDSFDALDASRADLRALHPALNVTFLDNRGFGSLV